ncbi:2-oxo-tetronate isomerase [Advenella sp. FME57]|uniref:2-oxo-tetronate isomerase n=1 Tax=Advenella sp. FME57 TaxID=2742604 RepID=UPI0018684CD8|nr:2-oxo-tetronate isomerase [Advenella sp. FME57]
MLKFAANLSLLYTEVPFLDRYAQAAQDGFKGVECLFPYDEEADAIGRRLQDHGLQQVLINAPAGVAAAGEKGLACLPGRQAECLDGVKKAIDYALILGVPRIHVMAGIVHDQGTHAAAHDQYLDTLSKAATLLQGAGLDLMIEPINPIDMPGYFLSRQAQAREVLAQINMDNLRIQMDLYHCQRTEGDVTRHIGQSLGTGQLGHMQIASAPDRHEPDTGELNYSYVFRQLETLGYDGWIGCEYRPARGTRDGLGWLQRYWASAAAAAQAA